jgi:hypothetical protein
MNGFVIEADNRPGEIARVTEAVAAKGINIVSTASLAFGDRGAIGLITNDEAGTRGALDDAGIGYREIEIVGFTLPDKPGALAEASRRLADAGVNIEFLLPTKIGGGEVTVAAGVDNASVARDTLGEAAGART